MSKDGINETQCEQMTTYAALILHDDGAEINAANIAKLIGATGAAVPAYYPMLYARMLQSNDVSKIIASGGGGGGGGGGAAAAGGAAAGGAAAGGDAGGKEAKKEEPEEEEEDMDFDLFG